MRGMSGPLSLPRSLRPQPGTLRHSSTPCPPHRGLRGLPALQEDTGKGRAQSTGTYPCLVVSQKILVIALQGKGPVRKGISWNGPSHPRGTRGCARRFLTPLALSRPMLGSLALRKPNGGHKTHRVALDKAVTSLGPGFTSVRWAPTPGCRRDRLGNKRMFRTVTSSPR